MPSPLAPAQIVEAQAWCVDAEQASVNTWYYFVGGVSAPAPTDQDFADALDALLAPAYKPMINNNAQYRGVAVRILNQTPELAIVTSSVSPGAGSGGPISLPRQVSGLTGWKTPFAGPGFRGRTYWPFPSATADVGDGTPTLAYQTLENTISEIVHNYSVLSIGGGSAAFTHSLYHRAAKAVTLITGDWTIPNKWATQRRRGSYGRANSSPI